MSKKYNLYLGKAGHLAVMSEFLVRGWNVAIPEVDIGDDIFVVQDKAGKLQRVQVKTSTATPRERGFSAQFVVSLRQLKRASKIPIHFAFTVRNEHRWTMPVIVRQDYLRNHVEKDRMGSVHRGKITFYFSYYGTTVSCSKIDLTKYVGDYSDFPIIRH